MAERPPRARTGDPELDQRLLALLDTEKPADDRDLLFEMLATIVRLAREDVDRLDLKITNAALKEMRRAFRMFAPYRDVPKVTIFGSARTLPADPLYLQARDLAAALAGTGWMVVTGAGPGIMAAGAEGAGRARSIGVNIRLPFEQDANPFIAADPKLVSMKYFFTRKLMLMKESAGFAVLPGGFGTLDEAFEVLTLLQTGKAAPAPIVLLDVPGGTYWRSWLQFIEQELATRGLVSPDDLRLCRVTDDVGDAVAELLGFYRNYHSIRHVGRTLVMRLRAAPTADELAALNLDFAELCVDGRIEVSDPRPAEVADGDHLHLPRLAFHFDRTRYGGLRALIDAVNRLPSAPPLALPDPDAATAAGTTPASGAVAEPGAADPALVALLVAAGGDDEAAAVAAAVRLEAALAEGSVDNAQQRSVVVELGRLVLVSREPVVRHALLAALGASSPFVGVDLLLELLSDHDDDLDRGGDLVALLGALDGMLERAEEAPGAGRVALLLGLDDPRPVLETLAVQADDEVAGLARAVRGRVDRVASRLDG